MHVRFAGGLNTKTDPKGVPATQLLVCENAVFRRATSLQKRYGYESLSQTIESSAALQSSAQHLGVRDGELLAFSPTRCYSRQTGADQWSDAGQVYSVVGADRPLVKTGTQQSQPDMATLSGVTVVAWEDSSGGVWWSVVDAVSRRILRGATQADALGQAPRCVPCGDNLHVYYTVPSRTALMAVVVDPLAPGRAVAPVTILDDLDGANPRYDAVPTKRQGTPAAIAWLENTSTSIRVGYVDQSGTLGAPVVGYPSVITYPAGMLPASPIAIAFGDIDGADGDRIAVSYVTGAGTATVSVFSGGQGVIAPIDDLIDMHGGAATSAQRMALAIRATAAGVRATVVWEEAAAQPSERFCVINTLDTIAGLTESATIRSVGLAGGAFLVGADAFAVFVHDTTFFNSYVALRINGIPTDGIVSIARMAPAAAAGAPPRHHLPTAHVVDDVVTFSLPVRERLASENNDKFREAGIRLFELDFASPQSHQTVQLGRGLYLGGACMQHYDGRIWSEFGFHVGPELITAVPSALGGALTHSTTYEYRAWYEWTDAQGEIHRGPTSQGTLVTMGVADDGVTLTLPTYRITNKPNVRICVARSQAAKTGKTAQLFRITSLDLATAGQPNGYVASSIGVDHVTFVDEMSDSDVALQEEIYTDGGVLSNDPAPLGAVVARSKSRLFATDPSSGTTIRYSQPIDDGYAVEWPPDLIQTVDPFGGDVTALASQDDRVVIFKESAIFVFSGDGPAINGDTATSGFTLPQLVTSDVGCTEPNSIVLTPTGHMFKSAKGIYLLGRDGGVEYVGAAVEAYNGQRIVRASVMPDRTQVVFLTDAGSTLLFDYLFGQWSTFTNHEGLDAAVVLNAYHYLRIDGRVFRETVGAYADDGKRIRLRLETAWLHMLDQLQGFQRFWYLHILGSWMSPHQLGVQYETDYSPGWTDSYWLDATGATSSTGWITGANANPIGVEPIAGSNYGDGEYGAGEYGGTAPGVYQWRVDLNEKGQSIRFRFEDFEAAGLAGPCFELSEMLLTGGVLGNVRRPWTAGRSI